MSREIKFRTWNSVTKEMEQVTQINLKNHYVQTTFNKIGYSYGQPDDVIVEQYTGMKDANDKEIYEGDIIKSSYKYAQPKVSQIIIENGNSYILGEDLATGNEMLVSDHISEIKVIGNVHENAELLED